MPQITISDKSLRIWAQDRGLPVGARGPISREVVDAYVAYHEQPLVLRIAHLERELSEAHRKLREAQAEGAEDRAIIKAQKLRIKALESEKRDLADQVGFWKRIAIQLGMAVHSTD